jgi:hypothetical protein
VKCLRYPSRSCANLASLLCIYCLAPIVFFSYHLYSLSGAPWPIISADLAIHPLMAYYLTFWDFYYWGQDRLGSIIPFLAAIPVKGFGLDAVDVVTWVVYALLLVGWAGMAILLQNPFLAWVFGVFLLTPPPHFAWLVFAGHPYTGQIFFFGLMAAALTRWPAHWVPPTLVALAAGSIWASDFSIIILGVIATTAVLMRADLSPFLRLPSLIVGAGALVFLGVAKLTAHYNFQLLGKNPYGYGGYLFTFTSVDGFLSNLRQFANSLGGLLLSPSYALLILSGGIAAARLAVLPPSFSKRCSQLALLSWVTPFLAVAGSHYVELNQGGIRYLSIAYVFFVLSVLFAISGEVKRGWQTAQYFLLTVSVAFHLASLIPYSQGLPSARESVRPLLTSGCSAYIGDYWTSYLIAGMFPDRVVATPHGGWRGAVRSWRMRDMVLQQQDICLIKDEWLEEFPSEISLFGRVLTRAGSPQRYGRFTVCRYTQVPSS